MTKTCHRGQTSGEAAINDPQIRTRAPDQARFVAVVDLAAGREACRTQHSAAGTSRERHHTQRAEGAVVEEGRTNGDLGVLVSDPAAHACVGVCVRAAAGGSLRQFAVVRAATS